MLMVPNGSSLVAASLPAQIRILPRLQVTRTDTLEYHPARSPSCPRCSATTTLHGTVPILLNFCMEKVVATTYDKHPFVETGSDSSLCFSGWDTIAAKILSSLRTATGVICVECYPKARSMRRSSPLSSVA